MLRVSNNGAVTWKIALAPEKRFCSSKPTASGGTSKTDRTSPALAWMIRGIVNGGIGIARENSNANGSPWHPAFAAASDAAPQDGRVRLTNITCGSGSLTTVAVSAVRMIVTSSVLSIGSQIPATCDNTNTTIRTRIDSHQTPSRFQRVQSERQGYKDCASNVAIFLGPFADAFDLVDPTLEHYGHAARF